MLIKRLSLSSNKKAPSFKNFLLSLDITKSTNYSLYEVARAARKPPTHILSNRDGAGSGPEASRGNP